MYIGQVPNCGNAQFWSDLGHTYIKYTDHIIVSKIKKGLLVDIVNRSVKYEVFSWSGLIAVKKTEKLHWSSDETRICENAAVCSGQSLNVTYEISCL